MAENVSKQGAFNKNRNGGNVQFYLCRYIDLIMYVEF